MPQRIPSHKPQRLSSQHRKPDTIRPSAAARGYCTKAHLAWRQAVLTRDAWQCQMCKRICAGEREAHADHILPISAGGGRYDLANGQCLCRSCHSSKTMRERGLAPPRGGVSSHGAFRSEDHMVTDHAPGRWF